MLDPFLTNPLGLAASRMGLDLILRPLMGLASGLGLLLLSGGLGGVG